jgi:hypothetical protein
MKAEKTFLITISNWNNKGQWQVFGAKRAGGAIIGLRQFASKSEAEIYAVSLQARCEAEFPPAAR